MNRRTLGALIALNVSLLVALVVSGTAQPAQGQAAFQNSNYMMISGRVAGRNQQAAVYVVELNSAKLAAAIYNSANNDFDWIAGREMLNDLRRNANN